MKKHPLVIETHRHAPELNRAYRVVDGKMVLVARAKSSLLGNGFSTIREFRDLHCRVRRGIFATIKTHYPAEFEWLERTHRGFVTSRQEALAFAAQVREKLAPGGSVSIKTSLVG